MRPDVIVRAKKPLALENYRKRKAKEQDYATLIRGSTLVLDEQSMRVVMVYLQLEDDCQAVLDVLHNIPFEIAKRTDGLLSQSRIIGARPRVVLKFDFCSWASLAQQQPEAHALIVGYARRVSTYYEQYCPELFEKHSQMAAEILPEWKLQGTPFTSGIINKNNPLPYHFDAGNFKNVWSNMLVFKHNVEGGFLAVPEYDLGFEVAHNSLFMFDGQNILHGVTPIYKAGEDAWRYSIVFYSLQQMWECLSPMEEVKRIQHLRTLREEDRLQRDRTGKKFDQDYERPETKRYIKRRQAL